MARGRASGIARASAEPTVPTVRFAVRLTPRGGAERIEGVTAEGVLRVRVRAAPVEGAANSALCRLVAEALAVPHGSVDVEAGHAAREKRLRVVGRTAAEVRTRWPGLRIGEPAAGRR